VPARRPTCVRCGYDLTGIGAGEGWATCPECGHVFDPARPYPRPWPHPARLAFRMAWPTTLAVALGLAATEGLSIVPSSPRARVLVSVVLILLYVAVMATPVYSAGMIAHVHAVRYERTLIWVVLAILGEVYAMGLAFVALLIAHRLWP